MSTETDVESELRRTLHEHQPEWGEYPDMTVRVRQGMRRARRHRRVATTVVAVGVGTAAGVMALSGLGHDRVNDQATDGATTGDPAFGCAAIEVGATSTARDELSVVLNNTGDIGCNVSGLTVEAALDSRRLIDTATPEDFQPGNPLANGTLPPDAALLLRVDTYPACQFDGFPGTITFGDGTSVDLSYPTIDSQLCIEPMPRLEIRNLALTRTSD
jgi:hypothetical protein